MGKWDEHEEEHHQVIRHCAAHGCPLGNPIEINGFKTCRFHANKNPYQWQTITKNIRRNLDAIQYLTAINKIPIAVIVHDESVRGVHGCRRNNGEGLIDYAKRLSDYVAMKVYENLESAPSTTSDGLSKFDKMLQSVKRATLVNHDDKIEYKKQSYGDS